MTEAGPALREATDADAEAINAIYNASVLTDTASWDAEPWPVSQRLAWLAGRRSGGFPVLVAVDGERVVGFATCGPFRDKVGYRRTAEHSLYVAAEARGRGVGRLLLSGIVEAARSAGVHALIGGLSADNHASVRLHESAGFSRVGHLPQVGIKFGRWLDLVFYQLLLDDAPTP